MNAISFPDRLGSLFTRWCWVALFVLVSLMAYEHSANNKERERLALLSYLHDLEAEKAAAAATHQELLKQINSQSDPAWIELTLMKVLGLVPEGQTKVFIKP